MARARQARSARVRRWRSGVSWQFSRKQEFAGEAGLFFAERDHFKTQAQKAVPGGVERETAGDQADVDFGEADGAEETPREQVDDLGGAGLIEEDGQNG